MGLVTQQDPIGIAGGLNLYGYANGDPINFSDPFGLDPCKSSSAWTECLAQGLANFGARRGGALGGTALFVGAALNAGLEASGINAAASAGDALGSGDLAEGGVALALAAPVGRPGRLFLSRGKGVVPAGQASQLAQYLGYGTRARGAPVSSHGQAVFTNGRNYISIDVDSHNGGVWKMFNRRGEEIGTFDAMLTQIK